MTFDCLLAKSWDRKTTPEPPEHTKLATHLIAVKTAGEAIVESTGELILDNAGLNDSVWLERLKIALHVTTLLHDIGKANDAFQNIVHGNKSATIQPLRHELVAMILLDEVELLRGWIAGHFVRFDEEVSKQLYQAVFGAIVGHHVKMDQDWSKAAPCMNMGGCGTNIDVLVGHPDLKQIIGDMKLPTKVSVSLLENSSNSLGSRLIRFSKESVRWQKFLRSNADWYRFNAVLKALLIAADVAGSAILPKETSIQDFIVTSLGNRLDAADVRNVINERLGGASPRAFQNDIGNSNEQVTLVEAGCGSGKTVAAYIWAEKQAVGKKLFFCYPTTGTATEGFLGYVAESNVEAELIHSRAKVDLEMLSTESDEGRDEAKAKIASLQSWGAQTVVCTADTVLALPRNNRNGLYGSPAILSAAFVFDELHAYDDNMIVSLMALIKALPRARFLLMTASLQSDRKQLLLDNLNDVRQVTSPVELEIILRYLFSMATLEDCLVKAVNNVRNGKKVLWIANTVVRAQKVFDLAQQTGIKVETYHSRFKYIDRVKRHRSVIDGFLSNSNEGLLAVTTQVAEMSLDLDADLLISEIAPIASLIQRLGRLNRRVAPEEPGEPREAFFIHPEKEAPYSKEELELAEKWIDELSRQRKPLSQRMLADEFRRLSPACDGELDMRTEWLDSGFFAIPGSVRDPGFAVQVVMKEDFDSFRDDKEELIKHSLPVNYNNRMENWFTHKGYFIAPEGSIEYSGIRGASWR